MFRSLNVSQLSSIVYYTQHWKYTEVVDRDADGITLSKFMIYSNILSMACVGY